MYRNVVTLQDAAAVLRIMECSAFAYGGFNGEVDDVHNVLYLDPMTMDFSSECDLDFSVFEYQILERYGMLDRMEGGRKQMAHARMGGVDGHLSDAGWNQVETPRDKVHSRVAQDHYGRFHFTQQRSDFEERNGSDTNSPKKRKRF